MCSVALSHSLDSPSVACEYCTYAVNSNSQYSIFNLPAAQSCSPSCSTQQSCFWSTSQPLCPSTQETVEDTRVCLIKLKWTANTWFFFLRIFNAGRFYSPKFDCYLIGSCSLPAVWCWMNPTTCSNVPPNKWRRKTTPGYVQRTWKSESTFRNHAWIKSNFSVAGRWWKKTQFWGTGEDKLIFYTPVKCLEHDTKITKPM